jgi:hypothetical protein
MLSKIILFGIVSAVLGLVSTCSSNYIPTCVGILRPAPSMLAFPRPGATAVPTNVGRLLFFPYSTSEVVTVSTKPGVTVAQATMVPAPAPLPSSLPTPAGLVYGMINVPTLSSTTTYTAVVTRTFTGACGGTETDNAGSFTTK